MRQLFLISFLFSLSASMLSEEMVLSEFLHFSSKFKKTYTSEEAIYRKQIFHQNLEYIHSMNSKSLPFTLGIGPFADLTYQEFSSIYLNPLHDLSPEFLSHVLVLNPNKMPVEMNWFATNDVSSVKDQGECASSYAFAALDAVESARSILFDKIPKAVSIQQVIDCETDDRNMGCNGGEAYVVYDYLIKTNCITTNQAYPYTGKKGKKCRADDPMMECTMGFLSDWKAVVPNNELQVQEALSNQPVVAQILVGPNMQHYSSGVLTQDWCTDGTDTDTTNYSTLLVGYGADPECGLNYWMGKNSWGMDWGIGGFYLLGRDPSNTSTSGSCMVASEVVYPLVL